MYVRPGVKRLKEEVPASKPNLINDEAGADDTSSEEWPPYVPVNLSRLLGNRHNFMRNLLSYQIYGVPTTSDNQWQLSRNASAPSQYRSASLLLFLCFFHLIIVS